MIGMNEIRVALENHLNTATPSLPSIAWPNIKFTPTTGQPYLRARFLPTSRRPAVTGPNPSHRHGGLFMVNVYTPEETGAAAGVALAERVMARFDGSTAIVTPSVTVRIEYSEAKQPLHVPPFYVIPVEISWYSFIIQGA